MADRAPRPHRVLAPALASGLAAALAGGAWLQAVHQARRPAHLEVGLTDALVQHLSLALPLAVAAALAALWWSRGVIAGGRPGRTVAVLVAGVATAAAVALAGRVSEEMLASAHGGTGDPALLGFLNDLLVAMPVTLAAAAAVEILAGARLRSARRGSRAPGRPSLALSGVTMLVLLTPAALLVRPAAGSASAATGPGEPCPASAPLKTFDVHAINVDITLNRFGDHDPGGKMLVLADRIAAVRAEEASRSVSIGLRDDPIQPLVMRANVGDCVQIAFTNDIPGGDYGLHIDGVAFTVASSGDAIGLNPSSSIPFGQSRTYRYWIPDDPAMEGAHYIHPGPGNRASINRGLYGALVVEPAGSAYFHAGDSAQPLESGWEAIIQPPGKASFREGVIVFGEVGDEKTRVLDRNGEELPTIDPHTGAYRPGTRVLNYRSEPFKDRLDAAPKEEAHGYGSYTFGDPATPMPRGYLGDPTKFRILHGGSEVMHVYHLHGGGIRWRLNPQADKTYDYADTGLNKHPAAQISESSRLDAQTITPGESYTLEIEGGAGGVQQGAGDFLFHCHIGNHYIAGMWSFWRVYPTLQPDFAPLPDRAPPPGGVTSAQLIGHAYNGVTITKDNLDQWIRPQLPPQGVRSDSQDASVWDWTITPDADGNPLYLGEPEDTNTTWPNFPRVIPDHPSGMPGDTFVGNRPVILFDPLNGRPAYPMMRTHVGIRPPFAPNGHSGAPWLGESGDISAKPGEVNPWAGRKDAICPTGAPTRTFNIVGIERPIRTTRKGDTDPFGKIFVLARNKAHELDPAVNPEPLAIRADVGDCVAVTLTNEQTDAGSFSGFSKINIHIHHVQFDTQASDGVITGMSYEQSMRPYRVEDPQLTEAAPAGATVLHLASVSKFHLGVAVAVGLGTEGIEIHAITAIDPAASTVTLATPLEATHPAGEWAGTEFVQYRWYPDVLLDNIFFHDHVDGLHTWAQGLVGQLITEPAGSTFHDPTTGAPIDSGTIADIHTTNPLAPGIVEKSFRELVLWQIDESPSGVDSTFNLKAEPFNDREGDPSLRFSSYTHGDPYTPLPKAYVGDPFAIRLIDGASGDGVVFEGMRTTLETRYQDAAGRNASERQDAFVNGISERWTYILDGGAGGPGHVAGDYIYRNAISRRFRQGAWGIIRVLPHLVASLQPLPGTSVPGGAGAQPQQTGGRPPEPSGVSDPCPTDAPVRRVAVSAVDLPSATQQPGLQAVFAPTADAPALEAGTMQPAPLVIHAAAGDCLVVDFSNRRAADRASFHVGELVSNEASLGIDAGFNAEQTVPPGGSRTLRFFADTEKIGSATISDFGGDDTGAIGMYGAVIVGPPGATFTDPVTGAATDLGTAVDVHAPSGAYRDLTMIMAENDPVIGQQTMPYPVGVSGPVLLNYRANAGRGTGPDAFSSLAHGDPPIVFRAHVGDALRIHALIAPGSEQYHTVTLGGLSFPIDPNIAKADVISNREAMPNGWVDAHVVGGAGGRGGLVGDMLVGDARRPFTEAGMWGLLRVLPAADCSIRPVTPGVCGLPLPPGSGGGPAAPPETGTIPAPDGRGASQRADDTAPRVDAADRQRGSAVRRHGLRLTIHSAGPGVALVIVRRAGSRSVLLRSTVRLHRGAVVVTLRAPVLVPGRYVLDVVTRGHRVTRRVRILR